MDLKIVLVSTKYPRNIGMVSRIMCNYGLSDLFLISPACELDEKARQGAAQGQSPLRNAKIYKDWDSFVEANPPGPRIAFSRRQGKRRASLPLGELPQLDILNKGEPVYLVFGAEDHGLSSDDLQWAHRLCYFELPGELKSMNLSHAVLVAIHSLFISPAWAQPHQEPQSPTAKASPEPILREWLEALEFELDTQKRWNALVMLNQLIMKASPSEEELHQLNMIVQQTRRRLHEAKMLQNDQSSH